MSMTDKRTNRQRATADRNCVRRYWARNETRWAKWKAEQRAEKAKKEKVSE